jgi:hypothetical protein
MDTIDIRTVLLTGVTFDLLCVWLLAGLWRQSRGRVGGLGLWVVGVAATTVGVLLIMLRGTIPDWVSILVGNGLVVGGTLGVYIGLGLFFRAPVWRTPNYVLCALFVCLHGFFAFVHPSLWARTLNFCVALGLVCAQGLWFAARRVEHPLRHNARWVKRVYGVCLLLLLSRLVWNLARPPLEHDFFRAGNIEAVFLLLLEVLLVMLAFALILTVYERLALERERAVQQVRTLSGLLPICSSCKKIRDDGGYWNQIEAYIRSHSEAEFSHGLCPDCLRTLYPEYDGGEGGGVRDPGGK